VMPAVHVLVGYASSWKRLSCHSCLLPTNDEVIIELDLDGWVTCQV
jgi:hypothetical protein